MTAIVSHAPAFTITKEIRFAHCDPARIIFYPRAFELLNEVVEDWFRTMDYPFSRMHGDLRMGSPTVDLHAEFKRALRHGDMADFSVVIDHVGRTSLKICVTASVDGAPYIIFHSVMVCTQADDHTPQPWPSDLRAAFQAHAPQKEPLAS